VTRLDAPQRWAAVASRLPVVPVIYLFVKYFRGMDSVIRVHDTLDGSQAVLQRMSVGDLFAAPGATLDFMLGGLPRSSVGSELAVGNLISVLFPLLWALLIAEVIVRAIAFYGMRRLLADLDLAASRLVTFAVPSLFAVFPFWHPGFASIAGVPLLLSALIRLHRGGSRRELLIVVLFPLLAQPSATVPYAVLLAGYAVIGVAVRRVPPRVLGAAAGFASVLLVSEWRQLYAVVAGPTSHRIEMTSTPAALSTTIFRLGRTLLQTVEKHSFDAPVTIVPLAVAVIVGAVIWMVMRGRISGPARVLAFTLVGMVAVMAASSGWRLVDGFIRSTLGDYPRFQVDRGVWLLPPLTYLALGAAAVVVLRALSSDDRRQRVGVVVLAAVFAVQGYANWQQADFDADTWEQLTLNEFYAPSTFDQVRSVVEADGEARVASVGFHPAVAVYNGLDTADGYAASYPLEYKERWRRLIAPSLAQDESWRVYFDEWGSRAYLFQPELPISSDCCEPGRPPIVVSLDPGALGELGITHVLSIAEIDNAAVLGLDRAAVVDDGLWVYRVDAGVRS